jgi:hypothetical protein
MLAWTPPPGFVPTPQQIQDRAETLAQIETLIARHESFMPGRRAKYDPYNPTPEEQDEANRLWEEGSMAAFKRRHRARRAALKEAHKAFVRPLMADLLPALKRALDDAADAADYKPVIVEKVAPAIATALRTLVETTRALAAEQESDEALEKEAP